MTKEELARKLDGLDHHRSIPKEYHPVLVESDLAIVMGFSVDLCYFLYPQNGEVKKEALPCWNGDKFWFDKDFKKILNGDHKAIFKRHIEVKADCNNSIAAVWCDENAKSPDGDYYAWTYKTDIPHATFDIVEIDDDDALSYYCKAIVFNINDLK
jgi:hypothetical protein